MRNTDLENQLAAISSRNTGPLSWWRTLEFQDFVAEARIVATAVVSIVSVSRLAPPALISELSLVHEDELAPAWNDLAALFFRFDAMALGLCYEIGGSCAALSARQADPLGTVTLLRALSAPYLTHDRDTRIWVGATWLRELGSLLNQTTMSTTDWWQMDRGHQIPARTGEE